MSKRVQLLAFATYQTNVSISGLDYMWARTLSPGQSGYCPTPNTPCPNLLCHQKTKWGHTYSEPFCRMKPMIMQAKHNSKIVAVKKREAPKDGGGAGQSRLEAKKKKRIRWFTLTFTSWDHCKICCFHRCQFWNQLQSIFQCSHVFTVIVGGIIQLRYWSTLDYSTLTLQCISPLTLLHAETFKNPREQWKYSHKWYFGLALLLSS